MKLNRMEQSGNGNVKTWVLIGPTASGKTDVALRIAQCEPVEIVSCDSMQVYRGMDIGTAKPSAGLRRLVPHHLIDIVGPEEDFSVGRYVELARAAIEQIQRAGKRPFVVGGTALYLKALLWGLFEGPPADLALRESLKQIAVTQGSEALYDRLKRVDPRTAERLHANDALRLVRAIEVYELTGRPISEFQSQFAGPPQMDFVMVGLAWPREAIYRRIEERVDRMAAEGLVAEVRALMAGPGLGLQAGQAVGYRHVALYLKGQITLEQAWVDAKKATRRFAKHQLTWFRHFPGVTWVACGERDDLESVATRVLDAFHSAQNLRENPLTGPANEVE